VTLYITDWSNHDTGSLTQSQADGLVGFWHKCTDGDHWYADPYFKSHVDMARNLGVDTNGGYHVLWGNADIGSQARWFVDRVRAQAPDAKVFMSDNEPFGYNVVPTIAQVNAFNQAVADYAHVPTNSVLAYCPQWHYGSAISGLKFPWVQSAYGNNPTGPYAHVYETTVGDNSSRWNGPAPMPFLQYGSQTDVGDANAFRGTLADFLNFLGVDDMALTQEEHTQLYNTAQLTYEALILGNDTMGAALFLGSPPVQTEAVPIMLVRKVNSLAAQVAELKTMIEALQGGGTPPAPTDYNVSLSGSVSGLTGAISITGSATPAA
jgi:hypothetical protein